MHGIQRARKDQTTVRDEPLKGIQCTLVTEVEIWQSPNSLSTFTREQMAHKYRIFLICAVFVLVLHWQMQTEYCKDHHAGRITTRTRSSEGPIGEPDCGRKKIKYSHRIIFVGQTETCARLPCPAKHLLGSYARCPTYVLRRTPTFRHLMGVEYCLGVFQFHLPQR
jgi:hypothetical protein